MTDKHLVTDLLARLPEGTSLQEIAAEIQFIAGVREGLGQLDRGEGVPAEAVEKMIASWTTK
jgi:predicted transcriptional regulator